MKVLGNTTSILSRQIVHTSISLIEKSKIPNNEIDLNLNSISCCILSTSVIEAFTNEISSLTHAFIENIKDNFEIEKLQNEEISNLGIDINSCREIERIRINDKESFYERYKNLLKYLKIPNADLINKLCHLRDLRNACVHFRQCDISVVEDKDGVIKSYQDPPQVFNHIRSFKINGWPIIASDVKNNAEWHLRISTNSMAIWSIELVLDAIIFVFNNLPNGEFKEFILKYYTDINGLNYFKKSKDSIQELKRIIF